MEASLRIGNEFQGQTEITRREEASPARYARIFHFRPTQFLLVHGKPTYPRDRTWEWMEKNGKKGGGKENISKISIRRNSIDWKIVDSTRKFETKQDWREVKCFCKGNDFKIVCKKGNIWKGIAESDLVQGEWEKINATVSIRALSCV